MNDQDDLPLGLDDLPVERLKHGTGKYSHVILVPQPCDSPNDPLNVGSNIVEQSLPLRIPNRADLRLVVATLEERHDLSYHRILCSRRWSLWAYARPRFCSNIERTWHIHQYPIAIDCMVNLDNWNMRFSCKSSSQDVRQTSGLHCSHLPPIRCFCLGGCCQTL